MPSSFLPRIPFQQKTALQKKKAAVTLEKDFKYEFNNLSA